MGFQGNTQQNPQIEERKYTISEYFDFEMTSDRKHEFYDGIIVECSYTSENHGEIIHNLDVLLDKCLKGKGCKIYPSDRMLYAKSCNRFYYPDVFVVCGEREYYQHSKNQVATVNPTVLIEVLSDSTRLVDKDDKLKCYRQIPSLKQYIIVEQDFKSIEVYEYDTTQKHWFTKLYEESGDIVRILDCDIPLDDIYFEVNVIQPNQRSDS